MNTPNPESGSVAALPVLCPDCHWPTNRTWPESCETCGRRLPRPLAGANRPMTRYVIAELTTFDGRQHVSAHRDGLCVLPDAEHVHVTRHGDGTYTAEPIERTSLAPGGPVVIVRHLPRGLQQVVPAIRVRHGSDARHVREAYRVLRSHGVGEVEARACVFWLLAAGSRSERVVVACDGCAGKGYVMSFGTGLFRDHCPECGGEGVVAG